MYSTCLWCAQPLGRNEVVERFPVGRRLAFDAAKGRLWVVCRACERWNLTPLEERWEAIEACERFYRDARQRVATDQIGLAKLREGLELVRIGRPLLPEFAAWRYGDQFGRRFRRTVLLGAAAGVVGVGVFAGQFALGASLGGLLNLVNPLMQVYKRRRTVAVLDLPDGTRGKVSPHTAEQARAVIEGTRFRFAVPRYAEGLVVGRDDDDVFQAANRVAHGLPYKGKLSLVQWHVLDGAPARAALAAVLPTVNAAGGTRRTIADSVGLLEAVRADDVAAALLNQRRVGPYEPLRTMQAPLRLAIEMSLHDADERRWLEGELSELERRWQEAEALAGIADRLLRPADAGG